MAHWLDLGPQLSVDWTDADPRDSPRGPRIDHLCPECWEPVHDPARRYCSRRCNNRAAGRRYREAHPEWVDRRRAWRQARS